MKNDKQDRELRAAIIGLTNTQQAEPPTAEALAALREGRGDDEDSERLLEGAAWNAAEARLLLDAKQFPALEPTTEETAAIEEFPVRDGWQSLRHRLQNGGVLESALSETQESVAPKGTASSVEAPDASRAWFGSWAVAAALLAGIGLGLAWPRGGGSNPVVNPAVVELTAGTERAGGVAPRQIHRSPDGLEIVIDVADHPAGDGPFEIRLVSEDSQVEPRAVIVAAEEDRRYRDTVRVIWADTPPPGGYRIELRRGGDVLVQDRIQIIE